MFRWRDYYPPTYLLIGALTFTGNLELLEGYLKWKSRSKVIPETFSNFGRKYSYEISCGNYFNTNLFNTTYSLKIQTFFMKDHNNIYNKTKRNLYGCIFIYLGGKKRNKYGRVYDKKPGTVSFWFVRVVTLDTSEALLVIRN
jgi:hypothetical protein